MRGGGDDEGSPDRDVEPDEPTRVVKPGIEPIATRDSQGQHKPAQDEEDDDPFRTRPDDAKRGVGKGIEQRGEVRPIWSSKRLR